MKPTELRAALKQIKPNAAELERRVGRKRQAGVEGITHEELATRCGNDPRTVESWLAGDTPVNWRKAPWITAWAGGAL